MTAEGIGFRIHPLAALPFALLLLAIAALPLVAPRWWASNRNRAVAVGLLAVPFVAYLAIAFGAEGVEQLRHAAADYVSFVALLGALYTIAGCIHVRGSLAGTPRANTGLLAIGAVLANVVGTTGASMLLIRPLLTGNEERRQKAHLVVFFIFIVSNCGGLLTPLGDPPLFLGFLKGVPFVWTLGLWQQWLLVNGCLLAAFHWYDQRLLHRELEGPERAADRVRYELALLDHPRASLDGARNALFLLGVVAVILAKGADLGTAPEPWPFGAQEGLLLVLAAAAYATTAPSIRTANRFSWAPILEVAILFAGIFITMIAPLLLLNAHGAELGLVRPWHYFWATGAVSAFLDNAPTYLTFAAAASGQAGVSIDAARYLADFLARGEAAAQILTAISCGAVFMGAMTYIGNGPNLMVKAIAEESGVEMPGFLGYMAYSCAILLPIFALVTAVFFLP